MKTWTHPLDLDELAAEGRTHSTYSALDELGSLEEVGDIDTVAWVPYEDQRSEGVDIDQTVMPCLREQKGRTIR